MKHHIFAAIGMACLTVSTVAHATGERYHFRLTQDKRTVTEWHLSLIHI